MTSLADLEDELHQWHNAMTWAIAGSAPDEIPMSFKEWSLLKQKYEPYSIHDPACQQDKFMGARVLIVKDGPEARKDLLTR